MQELQETQVRPLGQKDPLEEGMAPHSSILAEIIPWTEELAGLESLGLQRVLMTELHTVWIAGKLPFKEWVGPCLPLKVASDVHLVLWSGSGHCKEEMCPLPSLCTQSGSRVKADLSPHLKVSSHSSLNAQLAFLFLPPGRSQDYNYKSWEPDSSRVEQTFQRKST